MRPTSTSRARSLPVPSCGFDRATIDFLLTDRRDAAAAKRFFRRALLNEGNSTPRVINVDKNPAYPRAVEDLKTRRSHQRQMPSSSV